VLVVVNVPDFVVVKVVVPLVVVVVALLSVVVPLVLVELNDQDVVPLVVEVE
jgi:hypothetical protein